MTSVSHRRGERMRETVLAAAFDELAENGVAGTTIASVARRSGVHETTIYRRWATRENLLVEALLSRSADAIPTPDTGSTRGDLLALARDDDRLCDFPGWQCGAACGTPARRRRVLHARQAFWSARLRRCTP